jgi:hypothetical protein
MWHTLAGNRVFLTPQSRPLPHCLASQKDLCLHREEYSPFSSWPLNVNVDAGETSARSGAYSFPFHQAFECEVFCQEVETRFSIFQ